MNTEQGQTTEKGKGKVERYLSFSLGGEEYAIPLLAVREVIALPDITPVPYTPPHFLGIMNLRGQIISILDLRLKFNIKAENSAETAVIICDLGTSGLGIVISSVNSVLALKPEDMSEKPEIHSYRATDYITGVTRKDDKLVLLLDINKALSVEEHAAINKAAGTKKAA